jgi:PHD/YefM family antitoxin component YafN of YafNO toxin-antitoxin module
MCHNTSKPIYITKNGYGDMAIMSIETLEVAYSRLKMYQSLLLSEQKIKEGKTKDARQSLTGVREKYGL